MAEGGTMLHEKQNIKSVKINSASHARNEARIKQDEEELKELNISLRSGYCSTCMTGQWMQLKSG